jgi:hypothetical protein
MKKLFGVILLLALIAGAGVWYFVSFHLDNMIRQQIETAATRSLGTQVSVGKVETDLKNGTLTISGITVANPTGFRNPNAFTLGGIQAAVDYGTREIRRVVVERPEIVIEEIDGETNVAVLLANAEQDPEPTAAEEPGEPISLVIHHFRMNSSRAAFESASLERYSDLEIDAIEFLDIRGTPQEVAGQLARGILEEVATAAAIELLKATAAEKFEEATEKLQDLFKRD